MMIRIFTLFTLLSFTLPAAAQTAQKTFSKSFNTEDAGKILLQVPGNVDLKVWNSSIVRIEITVSLPSGSMSLLNELANVGRYNLVSNTEDGTLTIQAPNLQKVIRLKGEELREEVRYVVFVPKDMEVVMPNTGLVSGDQH